MARKEWTRLDAIIGAETMASAEAGEDQRVNTLPKKGPVYGGEVCHHFKAKLGERTVGIQYYEGHETLAASAVNQLCLEMVKHLQDMHQYLDNDNPLVLQSVEVAPAMVEALKQFSIVCQ